MKESKFKRNFILALIAAVFAFSPAAAFASDIPALTGRIVDNANIITRKDREEITGYLESLENSTGAQVAVLTIDSLNGDSIEDFSMKVAESWQLGQKDKDNGVLIVVALNDHKARIEVGYGLEGTLTDTKCGLILRNVIIQEFRNGDYSEGILKGVKNIAGIISDNEELVSKSVLKGSDEDNSYMGILYGFLWVFGWFILFSCIASGRSNNFLPWIIFTSAYRNAHRGSYGRNGSMNNFYSGGRNSFGGGGSRFSSGGGHFGGGGASGGW